MLASLTFALVLAAPVPKTGPVEPPKGAPPTLQYVKGEGELLTGTRQVPVTETFTVEVERNVNVNGKNVTVKQLEARERTIVKSVMVSYSAKGATFSTASGRKLTNDDAAGRLKTGEICVIVAPGTSVDPAFLAVLKDDTLVVTLPNVPTTPIPVNPPPPLPRGAVRPVAPVVAPAPAPPILVTPETR